MLDERALPRNTGEATNPAGGPGVVRLRSVDGWISYLGSDSGEPVRAREDNGYRVQGAAQGTGKSLDPIALELDIY